MDLSPPSATEGVTIDLASGTGPEVSAENGGNIFDWEGDAVDSVYAATV